MIIVKTASEIQALSGAWKKEGPVALVPTMGALHEGHLSLVRRAKQLAPRCIVSIFVNPLQFAPHEDFDKYPRAFENDLAMLKPVGVDAVFHPVASEFYPADFSTRVTVSSLNDYLCGKSRPHFFHGVATVCLKLFQSSLCDLAVFGEKDFQQMRILEKMVEDFNLPMRIVGHPIVREADGLAMSSRNQYLSTADRAMARAIPEVIFTARAKAQGEKTVGDLLTPARESLARAGLVIDYVEIASEKDLRPRTDAEFIGGIEQPHLFVAVKASATRLIDNVALGNESK